MSLTYLGNFKKILIFFYYEQEKASNSKIPEGDVINKPEGIITFSHKEMKTLKSLLQIQFILIGIFTPALIGVIFSSLA